MIVEIAREATPTLTSALARLIPQLSSSAEAITQAQVERIMRDPAITMFVASHDDEIVGTLTLAIFEIPTGIRAWIEDVVVDESARGLGAGAALTTTALEFARARGAKSVDLTSRPSREAANSLYRALGFEERTTNVYRYDLES